MTSSGSYAPLAILTTSYCGRRHSADGDVLTTQANDAFLAAVRNHRVSDGAKLGPAPKLKAITTEVDAVNSAQPAARQHRQGCDRRGYGVDRRRDQGTIG